MKKYRQMRKVKSAIDAWKYVQPLDLENEKRERLICLYLQSDGTVLGWNDQTENNVMISLCSLLSVEQVLLVTNHPDGNSLPTKEDIEKTKSIKELLDAVKIGIRDHIIVGCKEFYSYADEKITFIR